MRRSMRRWLPVPQRRTRPRGVFERFTDRARRVIPLAQEEARRLHHNYIGTEHLLLGLLSEGEGVAAKALESLDISLEAVRVQVEEIIGQGQTAPTGHIPFTPRAKRVLELSLREAMQLGHVRRQKEAAIDAEEFDTAAALRDREKQLLGDKLRREREWTAGADVQAVIAENQRVHRELERLRDLLRQHGIEPNGGTARTA